MKRYLQFKYWAPLVLALIFIGGMWFGAFLQRHERQSVGENKLRELFTLIEDNYVDSVSVDSLIEMSIPALLSNLDPHSAYIRASERDDVNSELEGSFGGIGIQFQVYNDTVNVVEVIAGGPSEKAGLLSGDRIVAVDGKPLNVKELGEDEDVRKVLRGPKGTKVKLTIVRNGVRKPFTADIVRGDIPVNSVDAAYLLDDSTGMIRVSRFARNTYAEFLQALNSLHNKGAKDYVIDLRGNTGGFMETAILMVNEFLEPQKRIVSTRGRNKDDESVVLSDGSGAFTDARLVVLIDEMSASSSEIFAGALQDNDRALILGRRSFGKGLVQRPVEFADGSEVRLTVQRYYTPSGRSIQKEYKPGANADYEFEVFERYKNGETLNEDSVKLRRDLLFKTAGGREVYGGGGIMPDVFVPNDTSGVTSYYVNVVNAGLMTKFAYEYSDLNRSNLQSAKTIKQLMSRLPSDNELLGAFVYYATTQGVPARWYYINISRHLIVTQLKALIARDVLGIPAYFEVVNQQDANVTRAMSELQSGKADFPIRTDKDTKKQRK